MTNIRMKPIDVNAPGSFKERMRILKAFAEIRSEETSNVLGQLLLDELIVSRLETTDGSDLEDAIEELSIAEADALVKFLLVSEVPTESAGN